MKKTKLNFNHIFFALWVFSLASNLFAQGPPINTDTPILLGLEGGGFRTFGKIVSTDLGKTYVHPFAIPYNVTTNFQIGVIQPFVTRFPNNGENQSSFGNLSLFAKQMLVQIDAKLKHSDRF